MVAQSSVSWNPILVTQNSDSSWLWLSSSKLSFILVLNTSHSTHLTSLRYSYFLLVSHPLDALNSSDSPYVSFLLHRSTLLSSSLYLGCTEFVDSLPISFVLLVSIKISLSLILLILFGLSDLSYHFSSYFNGSWAIGYLCALLNQCTLRYTYQHNKA